MVSEDRLKKFRQLPENIQDLLLNEEHHLFLDDVAKQAGLSEIQRNWLSYAVTTIFLKAVSLNKIPEYLQKELQVNEAKAFKISQLLHENMLNKHKEYFTSPPLKTVAQTLAPENKPKPEKPIPRLEGNIVDLRSKPTR